MKKVCIDVNHANRVVAGKSLAFLWIPVVISGILGGNALAADAPHVHQQLESGKNVRVIDLGANGLDELSEAVKRLNAPPPAAPADTEIPTEPGTPADPTATSEPPLPDSNAATDSAPSNNEHPAWLTGKWGNEPGCAQKGTAGMMDIGPRQLKRFQLTCDIKAITLPKADEAMVIYDCRQQKNITQEAHVFKKIDVNNLLLDHVENIRRCGSP